MSMPTGLIKTIIYFQIGQEIGLFSKLDNFKYKVLKKKDTVSLLLFYNHL